MAKLTKRAKMIQEKVEPGKLYPIDEALDLLRELSAVKFKESVDVSVNLGVDPRKSDQVVRGSTVLPNGTGKSVRVAVFTQGANVDAAKEAGADIFGMEDLAEEVKKGNMDFDVVEMSVGDYQFADGQLRAERPRQDVLELEPREVELGPHRLGGPGRRRGVRPA